MSLDSITAPTEYAINRASTGAAWLAEQCQNVGDYYTHLSLEGKLELEQNMSRQAAIASTIALIVVAIFTATPTITSLCAFAGAAVIPTISYDFSRLAGAALEAVRDTEVERTEEDQMTYALDNTFLIKHIVALYQRLV